MRPVLAMTHFYFRSLVVGWAVNPRGFPKCFFGAGQEARANNELGSFLCPGVPDGRVCARAPAISAIFTDTADLRRPGQKFGSEKLKLTLKNLCSRAKAHFPHLHQGVQNGSTQVDGEECSNAA